MKFHKKDRSLIIGLLFFFNQLGKLQIIGMRKIAVRTHSIDTIPPFAWWNSKKSMKNYHNEHYEKS